MSPRGRKLTRRVVQNHESGRVETPEGPPVLSLVVSDPRTETTPQKTKFRARRPVRASDLGITVKRGKILETERSFQDWFKDQAVVTGARYFHDAMSYRNVDALGAGKGFPDTWVVTAPDAEGNRTLIIAELKREDGKPSPEQEVWLAALSQVTRLHVGWFRPSMRPKLRRLLGVREEQ